MAWVVLNTLVMNVISEIATIYLSEELISANPDVLEITQYTGRLPRIGEKRAKELFGEIATLITICEALGNNEDVFVYGGNIHILRKEGIEIIPKRIRLT